MKGDALRGHLDGLILAVLEGGPLHGYAIMEAFHARSGGELDLPTGTLYPALRRLEQTKYVRSSWSTVGGRDRRTYTLTEAGRRTLEAKRSEWRTFSTVMEGLFGLAPGPA